VLSPYKPLGVDQGGWNEVRLHSTANGFPLARIVVKTDSRPLRAKRREDDELALDFGVFVELDFASIASRENRIDDGRLS
jgi:hypothetical protein